MTDLDVEDSLTKLNTQLNKSMVLMDTPENEMNQSKSNKSIKINTKIQPAGSSNVSPVSRKSILKKTDMKSRIKMESSSNDRETLNNNHNRLSASGSNASRPHNVNISYLLNTLFLFVYTYFMTVTSRSMTWYEKKI